METPQVKSLNQCDRSSFQQLHLLDIPEVTQKSTKANIQKLVLSDHLLFAQHDVGLHVHPSDFQNRKSFCPMISDLSDVVTLHEDSSVSVEFVKVESENEVCLRHWQRNSDTKPELKTTTRIRVSGSPDHPVCAVSDRENLYIVYNLGETSQCLILQVQLRDALQQELVEIQGGVTPPQFIKFAKREGLFACQAALHNGILALMTTSSVNLFNDRLEDYHVHMNITGSSIGFINNHYLGVTLSQSQQLVVMPLDNSQCSSIELPASDYVIHSKGNGYFVLSNSTSFILAKMDGHMEPRCVLINVDNCIVSNPITEGDKVAMFVFHERYDVPLSHRAAQMPTARKIFTKFCLPTSILNAPVIRQPAPQDNNPDPQMRRDSYPSPHVPQPQPQPNHHPNVFSSLGCYFSHQQKIKPHGRETGPNHARSSKVP
ncbi:hypothetical protein P9112_013191 [Eukaryota sp. TZLM1-RC]